MSALIPEDEWEQFALDTLGELAWEPRPGADIAPGSGERPNWSEIHLPSRMLDALRRFNPEVPEQYLQQALAEITTPGSNDAITENHRIHSYLTNGYRGLTYIDSDGQEITPTIRLIGPDPADNDYLAVNQITVTSREHTRRFDVVLYCDGMPMAIVELKQAGRAHADLAAAHAQLQTYLAEFPMSFRFCAVALVSDGITARYGTPFTPLHHFSPWNVDENGAVVSPSELGVDGTPVTGLELILHGLFEQYRFGEILQHYIAFDEGPDGLAARIAKPHQYFAVRKAAQATVAAVASNGKAGVVWHTQGSGKSMGMELYANLVAREPRLLNPTIVVITDRNELDGQLFGAFDASLLLPEKPRQIRRRAELRDELSSRTTGGIYFTTLQKFGRSAAEREAGAEHPLLSERRNVIVIVDEAHRSHYDDLDGSPRPR